jgi:branched-chain amino acid transport system permease protein
LLKLDVRASNFQFSSRGVFCLVALACVLLVLVLTTWLARCRLGAQFAAVRENEDAASALGVDVLATKLRAIALSGAVTAAAGCLYAQYFLYLDSNIAYGSWISVEALLAVIVGGIATPAGPIIGALALHALGEGTRMLAGRITGIDLVLFGLMLVAATAFAPAGLAGVWKSLSARLRAHA